MRARLVVFCLALLALAGGCGEESGPDPVTARALEAERELADVREGAARDRERVLRLEARLAAATERADRLARELGRERAHSGGVRAEAEAATSDLWIAGALAVSCASATLLVVMLLLRERRSRRVLVRLVHWIGERSALW